MFGGITQPMLRAAFSLRSSTVESTFFGNDATHC